MSKRIEIAVELPNPHLWPEVVEAERRFADLKQKLDAARTARVRLERDLCAEPRESDEAIESRLLADGKDVGPVAELREARRTERVTARAIELAEHGLRDARDRAVSHYSNQVRADTYFPAARKAVLDWIEAVKKVEKFRRLVNDIQARGFAGTHSPFNARVPLSLADLDGFRAFAAELVADGFIDRASIDAAFPELAAG